MATSSKNALIFWCCLLVVVVTSRHVRADVVEDKKQCQGRLVSQLSSCFAFVSGESKYPMPTCCTKLNDNYDINMRTCLCVAVRDRNDPNLGFNINATMALSLPYVCHVPTANVSDCPDLLHMDPKSADSQVFLRFNSTSAVNDITTSSNGTMKRSLVPFGTMAIIFLAVVFSVFFDQI